ncbi:CBS domain-containing protein [Myroides marinus]|uniref:CBS domain-containing protein n=1 Tax=Myroides marinus TaxID=703342 RepID=A0A1H6XF23_9FLAO|nr:CBS domain-containing protein [Myroides marinus]MDM1355463.1 CBS domain-containing protein [Myroides marinus]MDM1376558.1 CBS domain-containing protein [Myroides marinus]SEJ26114.1 CBS domain-containing protein [Myroides marinus]
MKQNVPVAEIMTKELITLTLSNSLYDAEKLFKKHKIRHIPIVEEDKLIGVLSYSDLLKISYADVLDDEDDFMDVSSVVYDMYSIRQVMAKVVVSALPTATIKEVTEILSKQSFHSIPIVDEDNMLRGIVTTTDLLKYFLKQYSQ